MPFLRNLDNAKTRVVKSSVIAILNAVPDKMLAIFFLDRPCFQTAQLGNNIY